MELKDIDKLFREQQHSADEMPRENVWYRLEEKVDKMRPVVEKNRPYKVLRYLAAASIAVLFIGSAYFLNIAFNNSSDKNIVATTTTKSSKEPSKNKSAASGLRTENNNGDFFADKRESTTDESDVIATEDEEIIEAEAGYSDGTIAFDVAAEENEFKEYEIEEEIVSSWEGNLDSDMASGISSSLSNVAAESSASPILESDSYGGEEFATEESIDYKFDSQSSPPPVASSRVASAAKPQILTKAASSRIEKKSRVQKEELADAIQIKEFQKNKKIDLVEESADDFSEKITKDEIAVQIAEPALVQPGSSFSVEEDKGDSNVGIIESTVTKAAQTQDAIVTGASRESVMMNARTERYEANGSQFSWMEGSWSNQTSSTSNFIDVKPSANGELMAQNYLIENSDTVLFEELKFRTDANGTKVLKKRAETDTDYTHYLLIKSDNDSWTFIDDNGTKLIIEKRRNSLFYHYETISNERITSPKKFKKLN